MWDETVGHEMEFVALDNFTLDYSLFVWSGHNMMKLGPDCSWPQKVAAVFGSFALMCCHLHLSTNG